MANKGKNGKQQEIKNAWGRRGRTWVWEVTSRRAGCRQVDSPCFSMSAPAMPTTLQRRHPKEKRMVLGGAGFVRHGQLRAGMKPTSMRPSRRGGADERAGSPEQTRSLIVAQIAGRGRAARGHRRGTSPSWRGHIANWWCGRIAGGGAPSRSSPSPPTSGRRIP